MQDRISQIDEIPCTARPDHTWGQKRPKDDVRTESGLPPTADIEPQDRHVPFVPISLQKSAIIRGGS
jgi:hypothetical protein